MKHKNIFLIVLFLTLFVFQQVQAGESLPTDGRPSELNAPLANNVLLSVIKIRIFPVETNGTLTYASDWADQALPSMPAGDFMGV